MDEEKVAVSEGLATEEAAVSEAPEQEQVQAPEKAEEQETPQALTPELRQQLRDEAVTEFRQSEDFEKEVQSGADKRAETIRTRLEGESRERVVAAERRAQEQYAKVERDRLVASLTQVKKDEPERFLELMENPDYASAWAGSKTPPVVDEAAIRGQGITDAYNSMFGVAHNLPGLKDLSDDEFAGLKERAKATGAQDKAFAFLLDESHQRTASKSDSKAVEEARTATESQTKAALRKGEGPSDADGAGGKGKDANRAVIESPTTTGEERADAFEKEHGYRPRM